MKRGFTLFLLALFLLNVLGFYGIFLGLELKVKQEMRSLFDEDKLQHQHEITIKVPITVPYATYSQEYTRVDGEFEHEGEVFRMVKQRLLNDTLFIVCVKDNQSKEIKQALADYVKSFSDKPVSEKGSSSKTLQNFIKDYLACATVVQPNSAGWNKSLLFGDYLNKFESISIQLNSPPPRA